MRQMNIFIQVAAMIVVSSRHNTGACAVHFGQLRLADIYLYFYLFKIWKVYFRDLDAQRNTRARIYRPPQKMKWAKPARISIVIPTSSQEFSLGLRSICVLVGSSSYVCGDDPTHPSQWLQTEVVWLSSQLAFFGWYLPTHAYLHFFHSFLHSRLHT